MRRLRPARRPRQTLSERHSPEGPSATVTATAVLAHVAEEAEATRAVTPDGTRAAHPASVVSLNAYAPTRPVL